MAQDRAATATDLAALQTDIRLLTDAVQQVVGTLETHGDILTTLLEAVTVPDGGV